MVIQYCVICNKKIEKYPSQVVKKPTCSKQCRILATRRIRNGYISVKRPNHPYCDSEGYIFEHRLILEQKLNRYLHPFEITHHINEIKTDNNPKNLELTTQYIHGQHHGKINGKKFYIFRKRNKFGQFI